MTAAGEPYWGKPDVRFDEGAVGWERAEIDGNVYNAGLSYHCSTLLSDGLETSGWEVHIILEKTKKELPEKARTVYSDPTDIDSDDDTLNDYYEFENSSDPYGSTGLDTDGDHIPDAKEGQGELTQIEGKDPEILKFFGDRQILMYSVFKFDEWTHCIPVGIVQKVSVLVRDNAGLEYVYMKISGQAAKKKLVTSSPNQELFVDIEFAMDWARSFNDGYDVNVTVADCNGNGNMTLTHVDGAMEGAAKWFIGACKALVEAVKKLASAALEGLWKMIDDKMNKIFEPMMDNMQNIGQQLIDIISKSLNGWSQSLKNQILLQFGAMLLISAIIYLVILAINIIFQPFLPLIIGITLILSGVLVGICMAIFIKTTVDSRFDHNQFVNIFSGGNSAITSYLNELLNLQNINKGRDSEEDIYLIINVASYILDIIGLASALFSVREFLSPISIAVFLFCNILMLVIQNALPSVLEMQLMVFIINMLMAIAGICAGAIGAADAAMKMFLDPNSRTNYLTGMIGISLCFASLMCNIIMWNKIYPEWLKTVEKRGG